MKTEIKAAVAANIEHEEDDVAIYEKVKSALEPFEGKEITKRLATAVAKAFGEDWIVHFDRDYGMFHINVRRKSEAYADHRRFLIGYESYPFFHMEEHHDGGVNSGSHGFVHHNTCYGTAAITRIEKNKAFLADKVAVSKLVKAIAAYKKSVAEMKEYGNGYSIPAFFDIEKVVGLRDERGNRIGF